MADIAELGYRVDSSQLAQGNRELDRTTKAAGRAETATGKLERSANKMGKALGVALGLTVTAVLVKITRTLIDAARAAGEFEQAMAEVSTLLSDTSGMEMMNKQVRELTKEFGGNAQTNAKALYSIISAGVTDTAKAMDLLSVANKLAIGGVTDVATAADGLTSIMNAYGSAAGSATDVSDALFVAMRGGKTTIGELSSQIGMVAPIASTAGVSLDELTAAIAAVTTGGVQTSVAVTSLRQIIAGIVKPSSDAVKISKALGIEFNLAGLKAKGLAGFLEDVTEKTGGSQDVMSKLFGSVEALSAVFALTGGQAQTFSNLLEQQREKAGQTEEAYAKMSDTGVQKYARLKAVASDALIEVGNRLLENGEAIDNLTAAISDPRLINSLSAVASEIAKMGLEATEAIKMVGGLVSALDRLDDVFRGTQQQFDAFGRMTNASFTLNEEKFNKATKDYADAAARIDRGIFGIAEGQAEVDPGNGRQSTGGRRGVRVNIREASATDRATKDAEAIAKIVENALGGSGDGAAKELTAAQKAQDALKSAIESTSESLERQIALYGQTGEAAQIRYDIEHGALKGSGELIEKDLIAKAEMVDLLDDLAVYEDIWTESVRENEETQRERIRAFEEVNQAIRDEIALLGMSSEQQEIWNNLKWAGVAASEADAKTTIELTKQLQERRKEVDYQIQAMDAVRGSTQGLFEDLMSGTKSAGDAFKDFAEDIIRQMARIAAQRLTEQLFGQMGSTGGGSAGGGWASVISSIAGAFSGGGRAMGGDVRRDRMYQVGERNRPELANIGGRQYLIPGDRGNVEPMSGQQQAPVVSGGTQNIYVQGQVTSNTARQMQIEASRRQRVATGRFGG